MPRVSIIHPDFSWHTVPTPAEQQARLRKSTQAPAPRALLPKFIRVIIGHIHKLIFRFAIEYSRWYGISITPSIAQLPFGLLLKQSDGTRLEEVVAMRQARDAGLPVPMVISYGEHPKEPHARISILMTRIPGEELFTALWEWYLPEERQVFKDQLRSFLEVMRSWKFPDQSLNKGREKPIRICSPIGTSLRSVRVPYHYVGPYHNEDEFDDYILAPHSMPSVQRVPLYKQFMADVATFQALPRHDIKYTHGDLLFHNLLVMPDGRISGFIDWESAGWYPSYWEFTTAWAVFKKDFWWYEVILEVGGREFEAERAGDLARRKLGGDAGTFGWCAEAE